MRMCLLQFFLGVVMLLNFFNAHDASAKGTVPLNIHRPSFSLDEKHKNLNSLDQLLKTEWKKSVDFASLSQKTLSFGPKAVPVLLHAMKRKSYPVQNRWIAMFSLTKLMGKNSSKVLSKFTKHPDWMMRLGALKCLLFLKEKKYSTSYAALLKDNSLVVRQQALKNIHHLELRESSHAVNSLLSDLSKQDSANRDQMTDLAVVTLAKLGHKESIPTLVKMLKLQQFKKNSAAIDFSLELLTGKKSPAGDLSSKVTFWSQKTT